jgi:hypothetical protein
MMRLPSDNPYSLLPIPYSPISNGTTQGPER